jgi:hypothetical protein
VMFYPWRILMRDYCDDLVFLSVFLPFVLALFNRVGDSLSGICGY